MRTSTRGTLIVATVGLLLSSAGLGRTPLFAQPAPVSPSSETRQLFERWSAKFENRRDAKESDEQDPDYLQLCARDDADLIFLENLGHESDPVRRLAHQALADLRTDRSFTALVAQTRDADFFRRERAVRVLIEFRQPRVIPVLLEVLKSDPVPQNRANVAGGLGNYSVAPVIDALRAALADQQWVAVNAAASLARLQDDVSIPKTYQLAANAQSTTYLDMAIDALQLQHHKRTIPMLLELWERYFAEAIGRNHFGGVEHEFRHYATMQLAGCDHVPESFEQWKEWWKAAEPLFDDHMNVIESIPPRVPSLAELGSDPSSLRMAIAVDSKVSRVGDPIRLELLMHNRSDKPYRTIVARFHAWWPLMAYGVRLERLDPRPAIVLERAPSDHYDGSYGGPPPEEVLPAAGRVVTATCLHDWLRYQPKRIWPLSEGNYRLTVAFDNSKFAMLQPKPGDLIARWDAEPIEFRVQGEARVDPHELLDVIAQRARRPWLKADFKSRDSRTRVAAWEVLSAWGDVRVLPILDTTNERDPAVLNRLKYIADFQFGRGQAP